jgi:hypothetical protein
MQIAGSSLLAQGTRAGPSTGKAVDLNRGLAPSAHPVPSHSVTLAGAVHAASVSSRLVLDGLT